MLNRRKVLRIGILIFFAFVVFVQLVYCIIDRILHTTFVVAIGFFAVYLFLHLYQQSGYLRDRTLAYLSALVTLVIIFTASIWSPGVFQSTELFNGGIGYISVKWFGNDLHCISNGREVSVESRVSLKNVYMTDQNNGSEVIKDYFLEMSDELTCTEQLGGLTFYDQTGKSVLVAKQHVENGYDIWVIWPTEAFQYKNIWGGVPHI